MLMHFNASLDKYARPTRCGDNNENRFPLILMGIRAHFVAKHLILKTMFYIQQFKSLDICYRQKAV